jgi:ribosomal protein S18 acetylase RimI-like enzyme
MPAFALTIREIDPADMDAIFAVREATWHTPTPKEDMKRMGITHEAVLAMMRDRTRGWIAESGGRAIGFTMGHAGTGEMWVIAVLKEFEGRGVGRALMARVEGWLAAEGCRESWLTTDVDENDRAVGFYKRLGWTDWKFEHGDRYMRKRLGSAPIDESVNP